MEFSTKDGDTNASGSAAQEILSMLRGGHRVRIELNASESKDIAVMLCAALLSTVNISTELTFERNVTKTVIRQLIGFFKSSGANRTAAKIEELLSANVASLATDTSEKSANTKTG